MKCRALTSEEVSSVIEGRSIAPRVPVILHHLVDVESFGHHSGQVRALLEQYPADAEIINFRMPPVYGGVDDDAAYHWVPFAEKKTVKPAGLDEQPAITDWDQLDEVLDCFPNPGYAGLFPWRPAPDGRYRLGYWWYCLFERHWQLRGMSNALTDYYLHPESVHRLFTALTGFYKAAMTRGREELGLHGIFVTDDLGTQTGPFFSPALFDGFFRPYYCELIAHAHRLGMHFWLHSCGCIEPLLPRFIDIGLDVIHPIQKYAMEPGEIARKYGGRICFWAGFDVQRAIPFGTEEDVRAELRQMKETFLRPEGRFMLSAGNVIKGDCPTDSLEALLEGAYGC